MLEARRVRFGLLLGATYALLLVVLGYRVYEDASIPLGSVALRQPEKLKKDFSLQGTSTERLLVNYLYAPLIGKWGLFFGLHAAFSLLLLAGLWRLAYRLIGSEGWAWIAVWTVLPGLYHHHWGSNELYYPYLTPSLPAKAAGAWVWVSLLEGRFGWAALALAFATVIHPSVGWQTWVFSLPLVGAAQGRKRWPYALSSLFTVALTLLMFFQARPNPSQALLWQKIFLGFRMHMHFYPEYFRPSSHGLFSFLLVSGLLLTFRRDRNLFGVFALYAGSLLLYVANRYTVGWEPLLYSQLPRATVWLKPLGVFVLGKWLRSKLPEWPISTRSAFLLLSLIGWGAFRLARHPEIGRDFLQVFRWRESSVWKLGLWGDEHLPLDAVVAAPPRGMSALFALQRSAYLRIDFIGRPDPQAYRQRLLQLYGIDPVEGASAWRTLMTKGDSLFVERCRTLPDSLRLWGITHVVVPAWACLPYRLLWKDEQLALYEVR
ncbi:MAG: hypothetical protein KatS3mg026_1487 [Bacteroidia bacterium]|nr:MAG: hypothetical protein KatS3mg026_1487 [Bacteroidia bacterium]